MQPIAEDNTVGSLSDEQRSLIEGTLLGDGAMRCKANALIEINHSAEQRSYVDWKYQRLRAFVGLRQSCGRETEAAWPIASRP